MIRNLLIHIAVNICNPPTLPHAYHYISLSKMNCFVFSYLSAFQRTQIVPKPLSGLVKLRLLGLPAKTTGRDITLVAAVGLPTRYGEVRTVQTR